MNLDMTSIESLFRISKVIGRNKRKSYSKSRASATFWNKVKVFFVNQWRQPMVKGLLIFVVCFLVYIVFLILGYHLKSSFMLGVAILVFLSGYALFLIFCIFEIFSNRKFIVSALANPAGVLLSNSRKNAFKDYKYVEVIACRNPCAIQYVLSHLKLERDSVDKRVALLVGRLGLAPSVFSAYLAYLKASEMECGVFPILFITIGLVALYILSFCVNVGSMRLDRSVTAFEIALESVEKK